MVADFNVTFHSDMCLNAGLSYDTLNVTQIFTLLLFSKPTWNALSLP